jgi:hypothetical protein
MSNPILVTGEACDQQGSSGRVIANLLPQQGILSAHLSISSDHHSG